MQRNQLSSTKNQHFEEELVWKVGVGEDWKPLRSVLEKGASELMTRDAGYVAVSTEEAL